MADWSPSSHCVSDPYQDLKQDCLCFGKSNLTLKKKQIFVVFNDCQDMLQNFDEIISQPFPITGVFKRRLTNIEVDFILQPFLK